MFSEVLSIFMSRGILFVAFVASTFCGGLTGTVTLKYNTADAAHDTAPLHSLQTRG